MERKVQIPYKLIMERMKLNSYKGEIEVFRARRIITFIYRFPKEQVNRIFKEMKELGLIEFDNLRKIRLLR